MAGSAHGPGPVIDDGRGLLAVYVGMPIDQAVDHRRRDWRDLVTRFCDGLLRSTRDVALYRPDQAFQVRADRVDARLDSTNRAFLGLADAAVMFLPAGVPTIGTHREIEFVQDRNIPLMVLTDIQRSFALADCFTDTLDDDGLVAATRWVQDQRSNQSLRGERYAEPLQFAPVRDGYYGLPTRAHDGDAGFDLYVSERTIIPAGQSADVPTNVRMALPDNTWGQIVGRSSTLRNRRLIVVGAVLDTGWRGELFASVQNVGDQSQTLARGERISQLILHVNLAPSFRPVLVHPDEFDAIPSADGRGTDGFGSSGR